MIELDNIRALTVENSHNLDAKKIIEILSVLHSTHVVPRDQEKFVFYVNNYIDWDQFNQLYNHGQMEKGIRNADAVTRKLGLASVRAINNGLEVAKEKRRKREEIMEK